MAPDPGSQPVFYYDLGDPACYLLAEQLLSGRPPAIWEPVDGASFTPEHPQRSEIEERARELGLQPVRWPPAWPPDSSRAMLAATYAKQIGRVVAFSLAAFRQAFAGGRDLGDTDTVLIAAAACEMHPRAVLGALEMRSVAQELDRATAAAVAAGVTSLPAVVDTSGGAG